MIVVKVNCDKYSPTAAASLSAIAGNASLQRHLSDGSTNDQLATNSDPRRTQAATQHATRQKLASQTSTGEFQVLTSTFELKILRISTSLYFCC